MTSSLRRPWFWAHSDFKTSQRRISCTCTTGLWSCDLWVVILSLDPWCCLGRGVYFGRWNYLCPRLSWLARIDRRSTHIGHAAFTTRSIISSYFGDLQAAGWIFLRIRSLYTCITTLSDCAYSLHVFSCNPGLFVTISILAFFLRAFLANMAKLNHFPWPALVQLVVR